MPENKLLELVKTMNGVEKRECSKFLQSPYFNLRSDVSRLWEYLLAGRGGDFSAETAFAAACPGAPFDDKNWRHLQSFLLLQIENFLVQRAFEKAPLLADLHLAPIFRQRNLSKSYSSVLRRTSEQLEKMPRDLQFYYFQYQLELEKYAAVESRARTRENNLGAVAQAFDVFVVAGKLRLACLMESHRAVFKVEYDTALLQAVLAAVESSELKNVPIVALYFYCYRALTGGEEADFQAFKTEIERLPANFPEDERRTFLLLAINFCIRRANTIEPRYTQDAFNFYKIGLETGALLENGRIGRFGFKNIVALGLHLDEHDWVEVFIENYAPFLEEKHRDAHRDYNLARVQFARKNYERAMPLLARVDESDLLLNLDSRIMLLKMFYEMQAWDALDALISSFKLLLLRKKKVIGYHQAHYLTTLRYVQKLVKLNFRDKNAVQKLRKDLAEQPNLIERAWILEQLP